MQDIKPSQFKLADDGAVLFQKDPTNPLPGVAVARVLKGQSALAPEIDVTDAAPFGTQDRAVVKEIIAAWMKAHIKETLEALAGLEDIDALPGPARGICFQLYEAMGIVPRENLEDLIGSLDSEMRQQLRAKQVRLGPVLVFLPSLNKPAAVRLRGLLWALWNEKSLPANVPPDGMVSLKVEGNADRRFYQAVGYPVYGPRAVRIDMLDRVISAVYDNAKDGKFRAEHKMAEWLGASIEDLYAVLEAMGHRKMEEAPAVAVADPSSPAALQDDTVKKADVKPELAMFRLKKGKAFEKAAFRKPKQEKSVGPRKGKKGGKHPDNSRGRDDRPKVISAAPPTTSDSPFAVLQQLKVKKDVAGN